MPILVILSRYLHIIAAALVIGSLFFMRVILPLGLAQADAASREPVFLRCRRVFKMLIHTCILLLLLTGAFNTWRAWDDYKIHRHVMHLWGPHMFLGVAAMVIALLLLAPKEPPRWHRSGAAINLLILFLAVLCASSLKYVRDSAMRDRANRQTAPTTLPADQR
ncbi:MAG TPA: hypothetical protein VH475_21440 [Tepidisphaeraceae bacterium]|jgi:fumarate reductase subunit D